MATSSQSTEAAARRTTRWDWFYLVLGLVFLAALCSRWLDVTAFGLLPALQAAWQPAIGLLLIVGLMLALCRRWLGLVILVPAFLVAVVLVAGSVTSRPPEVPPGLTDVTRFAIVSATMKDSRGDVSDIAKQARSINADAIVLTETDKMAVAELLGDPRMRAFKYQVAPVGDVVYGTALLSRHPLRNVQSSFGNEVLHSFQQPSAQVVIPGAVVRLQAVHVVPPVYETANDWRRSLQLLQTRANDPRTRGSFVMAGDFNAGIGHAMFRQLTSTFNEASAKPRFGMANTWPNWAPFTRLDHILSSGMAVESSATFAVTGSDHRGLTAVFLVPRSK